MDTAKLSHYVAGIIFFFCSPLILTGDALSVAEVGFIPCGEKFTHYVPFPLPPSPFPLLGKNAPLGHKCYSAQREISISWEPMVTRIQLTLLYLAYLLGTNGS
ncbi:hypothetical protein GXM_07040 [Nostoc sphaeroides CCNUC1]|uniref:Uncharacterized protein n=1 Tax=Nostoc sphaeroides CCNUC1 TaxID=2653204 RepID=A0A5P8WBK6_9NOSO|nr:hypothetical protein GXM_07040 [Nostoc sphaeroides CCNUC1]